MAAGYYHADTEDGGHGDDPSEDLLFMLIDELRHPDNAFGCRTDRAMRQRGQCRGRRIFMSSRLVAAPRRGLWRSPRSAR